MRQVAEINCMYKDNGFLSMIFRKSFLLNGGYTRNFISQFKAGKYVAYCLLTCLLAAASIFGQNNGDETSADKTLRGSGRVNASSLGMEFDLPLGSYPGRGINVPISLSYSSKLWRTEYTGHTPIPGGNYSQCYAINDLKFAESTASGWTTSMAVPFIEYVGMKNLYYTSGHPVSAENECAGNTTNNQMYAYVRRLMIHLPSGETHELRADDSIKAYSPGSNCSDPTSQACDPNDMNLPANWNTTYYAVDGSNIKYIQNSANGTYRLLMPDGSSYEFSAATESFNVTSTIRKATKFADRNGNFTTYYGPGSVDSNGVTHPNGYWKDTLGRNISIPFSLKAPAAPTTAQNPQVYSMPGLNGTNVTYKLHWKRLKGNTETESAITLFSQELKYHGDRYHCNNPYPTYCERLPGTHLFNSTTESIVWAQDLFNPVLLAEIELPNGQKYKFTYDVYGRIERIYYPTGGEERFEYGVIPGLSVLESDDVSAQTNFGVKKRQLYQTAGQGTPYEWIYSATHVAPAGYKVGITAPDGMISERLLHRANGSTGSYGTFGYDNALAGMPYEELVYSSGNQLISRKLTAWTKTFFTGVGSAAVADWHPRVAHVENFIYDETGNGVSATTKYEYAGNLSLRETPVLRNKTTEYGFVRVPATAGRAPGDPPDPDPTPIPTPTPSAAAVRITEMTHLINDTGNYPDWAIEQYKSLNLAGLVTASVVKNGAGTVVASSRTRYDDGGLSPIYRGNPTTLKVWDNTKGNWDDPDAYISTYNNFDNYGNRIEVTDARGSTTKTEYDSVNHAFPTKVNTAIPDPNSSQNPDGLAHGSQAAFEMTATFDPTTGLPLTATDANGQTTTMEYDQVTLRLKKITPPSGAGVAETFYNDQPNNYWVKTKTQIDMNKWAESITYFDGLGRAYKSEQIDSQGNIYVEKEFDAEGRVKRVTNPFRLNETKHWTTNVYDEASRVIEVVLPGNSTVKTDYGVSISGNVGVTKQVTDQAGKKRKGITDSLGRMVQVTEDSGGTNLPTSYVFDTLGNLLETVQGDQHRYFSYDSLGRLIRAKQPEQDVNTSLALPNADPVTGHNQWSVGYTYDDNSNIVSTTDARNVSVTGTYDSLNRLIYRNYSDATPDVSFFYDGTGLGATVPAFSKGKVTKVASTVSETRYTSFDNLGRLLTHEQRTTAAQLAGSEDPYTTAYTYNLSDAVVTETYPSGRVVRNEFDTDGALSRVSSNRLNQIERTYANSFHFNSAGAVERMQLGNGRWETVVYNERMQIERIGLGNSATDASLLKLEYAYGSSTQNNGTLKEQKISFTGLANQITQSYTYDDLNRLKSATETANNVQSWKQTFNYDRYGNRTIDAANTTTFTQSNKVNNPQINESDNRLKKFQDGDTQADYDYDANGSLKLDAENQRFVYDAENRLKEFFKGANNSQDADATYYYDGDGRRVKKIEGQILTIFVYNAGGALVAEYSTDLPDEPKTSYLTTDHLGSPRIITNELGQVVSRHDYLAFGNEVTRTTGNVGGRTAAQGYGEADAIRQGYTGYERDEESGLDFAQARYYNSAHGRFTSVDPFNASGNTGNPQSFNRYSYVLNSPHEFIDPSGLSAEGLSDFTGCSAEYSYEQCGGDKEFWGGSNFGDHYAMYYDLHQLPPEMVPFILNYEYRVSNAFYGGSSDGGGVNFDIHYELYEDGSNWTHFVLNVHAGLPFKLRFYEKGEWKKAGDVLSGFAEGATGVPSLIDRLMGRDTAVDTTSPEYQSGENGGLIIGMVLPLPGGKVKAGVKTLQLTTKARAANRGLMIAERFLGKGYTEIAPGVYRSADGLRQFRMTTADILGKHGKIGPHFNFEILDKAGKVLKNYHMPIK